MAEVDLSKLEMELRNIRLALTAIALQHSDSEPHKAIAQTALNHLVLSVPRPTR